MFKLWAATNCIYSTAKCKSLYDEASVLFTTQSRIIGAVRGSTLNYGGQLSLYFPHMLRVSMTGDLAHLQLYDVRGETRPIC